jgi:hypothetical protein
LRIGNFRRRNIKQIAFQNHHVGLFADLDGSGFVFDKIRVYRYIRRRFLKPDPLSAFLDPFIIRAMLTERYLLYDFFLK